MEIDLIQTQFIRLSRLEPNDGQVEGLPKNPRKITAEDLQKLKDSITKHPDFLALRELVVYPHGDKFVVLGGNMRLRAMRQLKFKDAPCKVVPAETPIADIKTFAALDNGSFGSWDFDALANEWDDLPLLDLGIPAWEPEQDADDFSAGKEGPAATEDDFDETTDTVETRCAKGDVWQLGDHRLMCGDSLELEQVNNLMGGNKANMVFTDPPYGTTSLPWDVKLDCTVIFDNIWSVCKETANVLLSAMQPFVTDVINAGRSFFRYEIIWKKTQSTGFLQANRAPLRIHENILIFGKGHNIYNPQKTKVGEGTSRQRFQSANRAKHYHGNGESVYVDDGTRYPTSIVEVSNWNGALFGNTENAVLHPTQKPVDLAGYLILTYSNEGDIVLDVFGGSGTTLIAAEQLGRKCYMMEIDPHYCDVIIARWEKLTGRQAVKIN